MILAPFPHPYPCFPTPGKMPFRLATDDTWPCSTTPPEPSATILGPSAAPAKSAASWFHKRENETDMKVLARTRTQWHLCKNWPPDLQSISILDIRFSNHHLSSPTVLDTWGAERRGDVLKMSAQDKGRSGESFTVSQ